MKIERKKTTRNRNAYSRKLENFMVRVRVRGSEERVMNEGEGAVNKFYNWVIRATQ
jgi:hypothetical protein